MQSPKRKNSLFHPEVFFPLFIFIFGIALILITPTGANYDEETYVARIFEMSMGHVMPNSFLGEGKNYPSVFISDSYRQDVNLWPVDAPTWIDQVKDKINWKNRDEDSLSNYKTRAIYFPTLFIIQALIMRITGLVLDLPIVFIYYALRFSYLIMYCLLVYLALKIIPFGKWVLGVIAIAPMSLILASSVSPDPIIFGVCFLFIAWILYLINHSGQLITRKQLIITCALILAVCTLKPNYIFLLFLLFALPNKSFLKKKDVVFLLSACFIGLAFSLGWSYIGSQVTINQLNMASDSTPQFWSLFQTPQVFIKSMALTIYKNILPFLREAIGVSGYGYWRLPTLVYFLYPVAIIVVLFIENNPNLLTRKQKIIFWLTGVINFLVIFVLLFVANTPLSSPTIIGIQGRYFIPFILLLLLPFLFVKPIKVMRSFFVVLIAVIYLASISTLFLDFHVVCGESLITQKPCKLPYYKNWGPETFIPASLAKGSALNQNIIVDCQTITRIDIWPINSNVENGAQAILNLRTGSGDLLGTISFSPAEISNNEWYSIDIPDVIGLKGSAITIEILPAEGQDLSGFALGVFPTDEYTKGELFIKDGVTGESTTADNDLIFKYQCEKP
ncbi:MAG: hypothetical protein C0410_09755 [Anaerolinea sp.]|nr:hypothetical protein [Anaerolinea sp.]